MYHLVSGIFKTTIILWEESLIFYLSCEKVEYFQGMETSSNGLLTVTFARVGTIYLSF